MTAWIRLSLALPDDVARTIINKCAKDWRDDYSMQEYCRNDQAEGWRALN